jgi:hypothetical protein
MESKELTDFASGKRSKDQHHDSHAQHLPCDAHPHGGDDARLNPVGKSPGNLKN